MFGVGEGNQCELEFMYPSTLATGFLKFAVSYAHKVSCDCRCVILLKICFRSLCWYLLLRYSTRVAMHL